MILADVITLVAESPTAHGVFDSHTETQRQVFAEIRSVGMRENYTARSNGLTPSYVFILSDYSEYNNEKIAIYKNVRYAIIRTYINNQRIELTVEEASDDRS